MARRPCCGLRRPARIYVLAVIASRGAAGINSTMSHEPDESSALTSSEAMDRVLQAERDALAAVAECERESADTLEQARGRRRALLERTQGRIVALHARAAAALERRSAAILAQHQQAARAEVAQLADPELRRAALERLAARLTTAEDSLSRGD